MNKWRASIEKKTQRKLTAQQQKRRNVWFGLGMFGLVGWSIAVPTLIGVSLGLWIDRTWPSRVSWTITLLFLGVVLGCVQAWQWIKRESEHD
jgi:ATP synthase protein I